MGARAVPILEDDPSSRPGPSFDLAEWKLRPPSARQGIVSRHALVDRLLGSPGVPVICVVAPPGYGKSTLLAQWSGRKGRRVGWVSVDRRDNDPVVLLTYVAVALDRIEPIDPGVFRALASPGPSVVAAVVPRLVSVVAAMTDPVVLVLDHLESLENRECLDAVNELAIGLPAGSQLALAARRPPRLPLPLLRAQGQMVEVGVAELAMDQAEGRALLEATGVGLSDADMTALVDQTEGWPVGLYLAALARKAGGPRRNGGPAFTGDDRFVADYLGSELLAQLPPEQVVFLTRTAVLERMSGPLCDAVLDTTGSGRVLESLEDSNLLVVSLDRRRAWYRYHRLFRELLRAELERREPGLLPRLHVRAAAWCEANGLPEVAIDHARAAGDADRVARLVSDEAGRAYASGRRDTAIRWYDWFEEQGLIERYPLIAIGGAWRHALLGQPAGVERWSAAADRASASATPLERRVVEASLALLHAALCRHGVERMRADARFALERLDPGDSARGPALHLEGVSYLLAGETDRADQLLVQSVEVATHDRELNAVSYALAQRSLVAIGREDWDRAETAGRAGVHGRAGRAPGRLRLQPPRLRRVGPDGPAPRRPATGPAAPRPGRPPAAAAHPQPPHLRRPGAAGARPCLPDPQRRHRRQSGPGAGPRRPAPATGPRHPAVPGRGAAVETGHGPGGTVRVVVAERRRAAPAPAAVHPPVVPGDR